MRLRFILSIFFILFGIIGCTHPINITPSLDVIPEKNLAKKIEKKVGYYISPEELNKKAIDPVGPGGDYVVYFPYKESEPALEQILQIIFKKAYKLPSLTDREFIKTNNIKYIFIPVIETKASTRSNFIWPPCDFVMKLDCRAIDNTGNIIWETSIIGESHLALRIVHFDHSRAAKEASEKTFLELYNRILEHEAFR